MILLLHVLLDIGLFYDTFTTVILDIGLFYDTFTKGSSGYRPIIGYFYYRLFWI